jgi:hypothetical protein
VLSGWLALDDGEFLQCRCPNAVQGGEETGSFLEGRHVHPADASFSTVPHQPFHLQPQDQTHNQR